MVDFGFGCSGDVAFWFGVGVIMGVGYIRRHWNTIKVFVGSRSAS